jgi:predicted PurR-regulated permease PerM
MKKLKQLLRKRWFSSAFAGCIIVAFYLILSNMGAVLDSISQFIGYFSTVIGGGVLAYMMNPLAMLYQRLFFRKIRKESIQWASSVALAIITVIAFLVLIMSKLIPQLFESIINFIGNLDNYASTLQGLLHSYIPADSESTGLQHFVLSSEGIINTIVDYILDNSSKIINLSTSAGKSVMNWVIALILSIYLLLAKKKLKSGLKRLLKALMSDSIYQSCSTFLTRCNVIMNRYVVCSLIDGLIVGIVTALMMSVCGMQYVGVVAVLEGLTNLIPTFGPIIGAIIGGFILLMVKPVHALIFLIFTIILQTTDGYIIKPKLFGNTLGVSGLWILIMILAGGRIYGIVGILMAIPVAAITDYIYRELLLPALERRRANAPLHEEDDPEEETDDEPPDE